MNEARLAAALGRSGSRSKSLWTWRAARVEKLLARCAARIQRRIAHPISRRTSVPASVSPEPQSCALTEALLTGIGAQVNSCATRAPIMELFDDEEFSGIAGTAIATRLLTMSRAGWQSRYPEISASSGIWTSKAADVEQLAAVFPLLADDCFVEADTPYLWLARPPVAKSKFCPGCCSVWKIARSRFWRKRLGTMGCRSIFPGSWAIRGQPDPRSPNPPSFYYHKAPLIRRKQISLEDELNSPPLPVRKLSRQEGEEVLNLVREALTVRYRELYGTTRGDPNHVFEADAGRGVHIFLWGCRRIAVCRCAPTMPALTVKNGVPINYIEGISLCEWMEVGFNTFYAFRDGETAWIYSKVLHLLHQVSNVTCFSVYPYQLGEENEEAIKSGAFWFYRKLGFRPGKPELLAMTRKGKKRRSPATPGIGPRRARCANWLRSMSSTNSARPQGCGTTFHPEHRLAVQRRMAKKFEGDPERMRRKATKKLAQDL